MGFRKIQAKKQELEGQVSACEQFVNAASSVNATLAEIKKAEEALARQKQETAKIVGGLKTLGVKEFEAFQKAMLENLKDSPPQPISVSAIQKYVQDARRDVDNQVDAWLNKLVASYPSDVKPGMTFKNPQLKRLYEVVNGPLPVSNPNLTGDAAVWFTVKILQEGADKGTVKMSLADLSPKKGFKYVKVQ